MADTRNLKVVNGTLMYETYTVWHSGNLTKLSQLQNDTNYITAAPLANYLPLTAGNTKSLTGDLYMNLQNVIFGKNYNGAWSRGLSFTNGSTTIGFIGANVESSGLLKYISIGGNTYDSNLNMKVYPNGDVTSGRDISAANNVLTKTNLVFGTNVSTDPRWTLENGRIVALIGSSAEGVNVGSLLVSNLWSDVSQVPNNGIYSKSDVRTSGLFIGSWRIFDDRDVEYLPNNLPNQSITTTFHTTGMPTNDWYSGFYVKGWTSAYAAWQLIGGASSTGIGTGKLHYRTGIGSSWNAWKTIASEDWVTSQVTTATGKYLPLTGGTLSGTLHANAGINIPNNVGLRFATTSANDTFLSAMLSLNGVLILGNNWGTMNVNSTTVTFAGTPVATRGVQIGTTSDIGWYPYNSRIVAGNSSARGVNVGSLLVSSAWADVSKVPINGIWSAGVVQSNSYMLSPFYKVNPTSWTPDKLPKDYTDNSIYLEDAYQQTPAPSTYANVLTLSGRVAHWVQQFWFGNDGIIRTRSGNYTADSTLRTFSDWQTLAQQSWVTSQVSKYLPLTGGTITGNLRINGTAIHDHFVVNSTHSSETVISVERNGTKKAAFGYYDNIGAYLYNYPAARWLNLSDNGLARISSSVSNHVYLAQCTAVGSRGNNFVTNNNEFNFAPTGYNNYIWFNFRSYNNTQITISEYYMGRGDGNFAKVRSSGYIINGGTASQFLKANGTLDSNTYATTSQLGSYLPLSGGTLSGTLRANTGIIIPNSTTIVQEQNTTSNYTRAIRFKPGTDYGGEIGSHSTGGSVDNTGAIIIVPYKTTANPWERTVGLFIAKNELLLDGKAVALKQDIPSVSGYLTKASADTYYAPITTSMTVTNATNYINVSLPSGLLTTAAAKGYLEWWDSTSGWYNFKTGWIQAQGEVFANGGILKSTQNSNTVSIGSQNSSYCHFSNSAAIPFHFNRDVRVQGNIYMGSSYSDLVASQSWVNTRLGSYLPLSGGTMTGNIGMSPTKGLITRTGNTTYTAGIFSDTNGNECLALWAKNTVTRLRWNAGVDMEAGTTGLMMGITPDFEISKASGTATGYIAGNVIMHAANYTSYTVSKTGAGASGTWRISISGNAATATKLATARTISLTGGTTGSASFDGSANASIATTTKYISGTYTGSGGVQPPSYAASGTVRWNMMHQNLSNGGGYCDWMMMDTYTGSDVPYVTLFGVLKAAEPRAFIASAPKGNTDKATWVLKELALKTDIPSLSGYATQTWCNGQFPTKTGSGASGSWGISITGNAATATKVGSSTVGSSTTPIYLSGGTPTVISSLTKALVVSGLNASGTNTITQYCDFTAGAGNSGSDTRFKCDVKLMDNVLSDLMKIEVVSYTWQKDGEATRDTFGVKAQQLIDMDGMYKKIIHERDDTDKTLWVEYDRIGVLALKGLQEEVMIRETKIKQLENDINTLKETVNAQNEKINKICAMMNIQL